MNEIATLKTGGAPAPIVPHTIEQVYRLAELVTQSGLAPSGFKNAQAVTVAILKGMEIGLTPMAALESIAVINGKACLWGDGMLAVVYQSGVLEWIEEVETEGTATCRVKRKGMDKVVERSFSEADAKQAGLAGKSGPHQQYPKRMRQMRARAFALRDAFPDVLKGMKMAEEMREPEMVDITPRADVPLELPDIPDTPDELAKEVAKDEAQAIRSPEEQPDKEPDILLDASGFVEKLKGDLSSAPADERGEVWEMNLELIGRLPRADRVALETYYEGL